MLVDTREIFGNCHTTREKFEGMERALLFAKLYAPSQFDALIDASLDEAAIRRMYFEMFIWPSPDTRKEARDHAE